MNDLVLKLRAPVTMSMFATKTDLYMDILQSRKEAADHIEAQENLIDELAACLQWMVDNDETNEGDEPLQDYGGKTWDELNEYWIEGLNRARSAISKASKSNPNTPERNDE